MPVKSIRCFSSKNSNHYWAEHDQTKTYEMAKMLYLLDISYKESSGFTTYKQALFLYLKDNLEESLLPHTPCEQYESNIENKI